jgi:hypothetical protein
MVNNNCEDDIAGGQVSLTVWATIVVCHKNVILMVVDGVMPTGGWR